jgi:hypothetical protein
LPVKAAPFGHVFLSLIRSGSHGLDAQILVRECIFGQETALVVSVRKEVMHVKDVKKSVVYSYSLDQAIEDGYLVEIFKKRWQNLSGGKPIVATRHIFEKISLAGIMEIWNEFVEWRKTVMPTLPEEDQLFHTEMNGKTVWVFEDAQAFTILYPQDY